MTNTDELLPGDESRYESLVVEYRFSIVYDEALSGSSLSDIVEGEDNTSVLVQVSCVDTSQCSVGLFRLFVKYVVKPRKRERSRKAKRKSAS